MAFLKVLYSTKYGMDELIERLELLDCLKSLGDWHEHRLQCVVRSGLSLLSAPARSVERDRLANGMAVHIELNLVTGEKLVGQVRQDSLLLGSKDVESSVLNSDVNVLSVISSLQGMASDVEVEIG